MAGHGSVSPRGDLRSDQQEVDGQRVIVRRSSRRRKTVTAYKEAGQTVVAIPSGLTRSQERQWIKRVLTRFEATEKRRYPSAKELTHRAQELGRKYLGAKVEPTSVTWVENQESRWGSCTPSRGTIRISDRVQGMPVWVIDYVLLHELAHLIIPGHGEEFWDLLSAYPHTERARGFLQGVSYAVNEQE